MQPALSKAEGWSQLSFCEWWSYFQSSCEPCCTPYRYPTQEMVLHNEEATYAYSDSRHRLLAANYMFKYNANGCGSGLHGSEKSLFPYKESHSFGHGQSPVFRGSKRSRRLTILRLIRSHTNRHVPSFKD